MKFKVILTVFLIFTLLLNMSYSQKAETIGEFIIKIVRAMGLEKELPKKYTDRNCLTLLRKKGLIDESLFIKLSPMLNKPLTKEIMAFILVDVWDLKDKLPANAKPQDYINLLVKYGVMEPGKPTDIVSSDEVARFFENPICAQALSAPHLKPVSPVRP